MTDIVALVADAHPHYKLVPVGRDSKVSLTRWDAREFPLAGLLAHVRRGGNVAARVGETRSAVRAVVVDRDSRDRETWAFVRDHGLHRSAMQVETASGNWHLWFSLPPGAGDVRSRIKLLVGGRKIPVDVKATGYVLLPGSMIGRRAYRFRDGKGFKPPEELVPLPDSVVELLTADRQPSRVIVPDQPVGDRIARVRSYIRKAVAVSGAGGHNTTFRVACRLADAGLSEDEVLAELIAWQGDGCAVPEWTVAELAHKARDAVRRLNQRGES